MKRYHVHVSVNNQTESIGFYSALFGAETSVKNQITPNGCWMIPGLISLFPSTALRLVRSHRIPSGIGH
jgi:hypothetical protein